MFNSWFIISYSWLMQPVAAGHMTRPGAPPPPSPGPINGRAALRGRRERAAAAAAAAGLVYKWSELPCRQLPAVCEEMLSALIPSAVTKNRMFPRF